ncbi:hypothetical protein DFJ74DRAFT_681226 [Hyaloraphidium curvatum]|nr:hypothetical protein DFJ74DRAFT_681226 [Hyaloraphidium curvatum]
MGADGETITYSDPLDPDGFSRTGAFASLLQTGDFSDVTVTGPDGLDRKLHRMILATHSGFFRTALTSDFREAAEHAVALHFPDPRGVWPAVLEFLYSGTIAVSRDSCFALYAWAVQLDVPRLRKHAGAFVEATLRPENALEMLSGALEFDECREFAATIIGFAAKHFGTVVWNGDFSALPLDVMEELLSHPDLLVLYEMQVLYCAVKYVEGTKPAAPSTASIAPTAAGASDDAPAGDDHSAPWANLFSNVRFEAIPNQILAYCDSFPFIPRPLVLRGALDRLSAQGRPFADPKLGPGSRPLRAPRGTYLGEAPRLSTMKDRVRATASGVASGDVNDVMGASLVVTDNNAGPWIMLALPKPYRISRYGFSSPKAWGGKVVSRMANWVLEGAPEPGAGWLQLHLRKGDPVDTFLAFLDETSSRKPVQFVRIRGVGAQESVAGAGGVAQNALAVAKLDLELITEEELQLERWRDVNRGEVGVPAPSPQ